MQEDIDAGVVSMLFGAGVVASDTHSTDDHFWILKVQEYYGSGVINLAP